MPFAISSTVVDIRTGPPRRADRGQSPCPRAPAARVCPPWDQATDWFRGRASTRRAMSQDFYWISSPEVTHSRNLAQRSEVSIVVFDSRAPVGETRAVYMAATAMQVPEGDLDRGLAVYPGRADRGGRPFAPAELRPPAPYRLYRAAVTEHSVLCPRNTGEPCADHGLAYDHRTAVELS